MVRINVPLVLFVIMPLVTHGRTYDPRIPCVLLPFPGLI